MRANQHRCCRCARLSAACSDQNFNEATAPPSWRSSGPALSLSAETSDSAAIESLIIKLYSNLNNGNGPATTRP